MPQKIFLFFLLLTSTFVGAQKQEPRLVLPVGHLGGVTKLDGSPNEKLLLTEDLNSDIIVVDSDKLIELQRHNYENWKITSSTFLNDSSIISICNDTLVAVWNFYSDKVELYPISVPLNKVYVEQHGLYCIDKKGSVYKFQLSSKQIQLEKFISQRAKEIYFKSKNEIFLFKGKNLLLVSLDKGKQLKRKFDNEITTLTCNSKNGNVILGFEDGNLIEINTSFNTLHNLTPASDKISFVEYLNDSSMISGSYNYAITKESENDSLERIYLDDWIVGGIKSQGFLIACSWNGQLVKLNSENIFFNYKNFESLLKKSTAFLQKDANLYICYNDGTINRFDVNDFKLLNEFNICSSPLVTFDINSKQNKLIAASKSQLFNYDLVSQNFTSLDSVENIWTARFFGESDNFIYSNNLWLNKYKDNIEDSIALDAWFTVNLNKDTFFATGSNKIVFVNQNRIESVDFPGLGFIDIGKKLKNNYFLLATLEQRKLYTIDSQYNILNQLKLLKPIIEIEPYGEASAFLLSEDGSLAVFDSERKVYKVLKKVQEYGSWDFLLNAKENIIIFPNSNMGVTNMNIDVLNLDGVIIKKLQHVGGEVVCIANSYHSIDFNHLDSNKVVFIVSDGSVKLWDINSDGKDPITKLGFDYYNLLKDELKDFNINGAFLKSGLLKLPIPGIDTLTFMNLKNGDWLVHDSKFRFDGTPGAIEKLYFTCGLEIIELNQIRDSLYIPNIVQRYLNGENLDLLPKLSDLNICGVTPVVDPLENDKSGKQGYRIIPRSGGVGDVDVYINGVLRLSTNAKKLKRIDGNYMLYVEKELLDLYQIQGEELKLKVIAKTANNSISSRGVVIDIESDEKTSFKKPSLHAVMIGVDDYKDNALDLNYASKDANDFQEALQLASRKYFNLEDDTNRVYFYNLTVNRNGQTGNERIKGLTPDRGNILAQLREIAKTSDPEDILLIFFAGHGEIVDKDELLLLTTESGNGEFHGIKMRELLGELNKIPAGKRVMILDACHSGAAINNLDIDQYAGKRDIKDAELKSQRLKELDKLASKSGFAVITASSSDQKALELPQYEHGLMTYALLNSMLNNPAALDDQNQLQLAKWLLATEEEVKKLNKDQTAETMVPMNFALGKIDEEVRSSIVLKEIPTINVSNVLNAELAYDDLELKAKLSSLFKEGVRGSGGKVLYADTPGAVQVNISYLINGSTVTLEVVLLKDKKLMSKFSHQCQKNDLDTLCQSLIANVLERVR